MADVRAMLRAERAARAPASTPLRHATQAPAQPSKKRKANDGDDDARKRSKVVANANVPAGFFDDQGSAGEVEVLGEQTSAPEPAPAEDADTVVAVAELDPDEAEASSKAAQTGDVTESAHDGVDEAEWAAFQALVSTAPTVPSALDAINANAIISGAAMTAEEAAREAERVREESKANRPRREEEIEEEKEEAARQMEEELEVMEEMEERLRRLKAKREMIRAGGNMEVTTPAIPMVTQTATVDEEDAQGEDSGDDVDEFDGWRFGGT